MSRSGATSPRIEYSPSTTTRRLRPARQPLELLAQAVGRVVAEADHLRRRLPRRVVNAGVAVAVDQDDVAGAAQAADERQVRLVAGAEDDRVALAEPVGELALEILVHRQRAVGGARAGRAGAVVERPRGAPRRSRRDAASDRDSCSSRTSASAGRRSTTSHGPEHAIDDRQARHRRAVRERRAALSRSPAACRADPSTPLIACVPSPIAAGRQFAALVARLRRRPLHFAAGRAADRAAAARSPPRRRRARTGRRSRRRIASVSTSAGTVPLGSTTITTRSAWPLAVGAERDHPAAPHAGESSTAHSRSCGWYFRPLTMMMSFARPQTNSSPPDRYPRSPVCSQPSRMVWAVSASCL